jgi:hypothetical protein
MPNTNKPAFALARICWTIDGCICTTPKIFIGYRMQLLMSCKKLTGTLINLFTNYLF